MEQKEAMPAPAPDELRREFLLDPGVAFLNHPGRRPEDDLMRLSVAGYTTREEIDRLLAALVRELDAEHGQEDE
jgi:selenocysteine lyase/cysteine desulfurase